MRSVILVGIWVSLSFVVGCAPMASSSRIGPPVSAKSEECDIEILADGQTPDRPYRDVGVVSLRNCQDYTSGPCKKWLTKEACRLGGDVAYQAMDTMRDGRSDDLAGTVTVSVTIGTYINHMVPEENDPVLNATPEVPCDDTDADPELADDPEAQMCLE